MPHEMIDEIQSRKGEKVALFLTIENATGLVLGAIPGFLITFRNMPWYLTFLITFAAGGLGLLVTLEVGGMAMYERLVWWVRGYLHQKLTSTRITPEDVTGGRALGQRDAALPIGGAVRLVKRTRSVAALSRPAATPLGRRSVQAQPAGHRENHHADPSAQ